MKTLPKSMARLIRFAITGIAGTALDFLFFTLALNAFENSTLARCIGYLFGTLWAFIVNKSWVFASDSGISSLIPFLLLYGSSGVMAVTIQWVFASLELEAIQVFTAYVISLIFATAVNFLGMRLIVFRDSAGAQ